MCNALADRGKRVIVAGLDQDYLGKPFEPMPQLLAIAEYITKTLAICMVCGNPANHTQRLVASEDRVLVGAHGHVRGALPALLRSAAWRASAPRHRQASRVHITIPDSNSGGSKTRPDEPRPDEFGGPDSLVRLAGAEPVAALRPGLPRGQPQGRAELRALSPRASGRRC